MAARTVIRAPDGWSKRWRRPVLVSEGSSVDGRAGQSEPVSLGRGANRCSGRAQARNGDGGEKRLGREILGQRRAADRVASGSPRARLVKKP
jgi:hypothetical protein